MYSSVSFGVQPALTLKRESDVSELRRRPSGCSELAGRLVVARERPEVAIGVVGAALHVVLRLARAEHRVAVPAFGVAAAAGPEAGLGLERLRRRPRHEVDRAAHRARAVEHRGVALLNLNLGDVGGQEAAKSRRLSAGR